MHPSRAIRGRTTRLLEGRRIVIGLSGSIAAIEVPKIVRELIRHGADVQAVMSPDAARIITPEAVEFATGHRPVLQLTGNVEHVTLLGPGEGRADLFLIAPATANTLAKIAHGIDDTTVTSCASVALGGGVPIVAVPAMHSLMGANPAVRESVERLKGWGVEFLYGPAVEGEEKIAGPEEVAAAVLHRLANGPWRGRKVTVIGGAARESIDAVRSVTNESSGATAVALAVQAHYRGADVALWAGALEVPLPSWLAVRRWRSVADLVALARANASTLAGSSVVLVPAALSDYTLTPRPGKIASRGSSRLLLALRRAPKALPELRALAPPPTRLVAYKLLAGARPDELERDGRRLMAETGADWVVANEAATMGAAETSALVLGPDGGRHWLRGPKSEVAGKLLDDLGRELTNLAPALPRAPRSANRNARRPGRARSRRARD
ncbi:MAG TPA: bifunctional phosphopantothenoylcysteine decarboxylase/phosphopantothenate--cysteine ligase CoaBC [Thermoplasmata archaeon]|nr:bifunctional phosphopantothenoylcysteine decarboxylase/phosphopantothenate--cysteine ligase CoaBC [Thermoplasmata archaeon]